MKIYIKSQEMILGTTQPHSIIFNTIYEFITSLDIVKNGKYRRSISSKLATEIYHAYQESGEQASKKYVTHHKDKNRSNNSLDNFIFMESGMHSSMHNRISALVRKHPNLDEKEILKLFYKDIGADKFPIEQIKKFLKSEKLVIEEFLHLKSEDFNNNYDELIFEIHDAAKKFFDGDFEVALKSDLDDTLKKFIRRTKNREEFQLGPRQAQTFDSLIDAYNDLKIGESLHIPKRMKTKFREYLISSKLERGKHFNYDNSKYNQITKLDDKKVKS